MAPIFTSTQPYHIERVLIHRSIFVTALLTSIETTSNRHGRVRQSMANQIILRDACHVPPLERVTASDTSPELAPLPRLHLDKTTGLAIARDDVQFSTATPISPGKNCVPATLQLLAGEIFAQFPE